MAPPRPLVYTPAAMRPPRPPRTALALATLAALALARPPAAAAQDGFRVGVALGGTGLVGVVIERLWGRRAVELLVTTFSFRDVAVSVVGKEYFGASRLRPVLGAGLSLITGEGEGGRGAALVARFPAGADWWLGSGHSVTAEINVNRALWVRRPDPTEERPMSRRLIPIPGLSYRWGEQR